MNLNTTDQAHGRVGNWTLPVKHSETRVERPAIEQTVQRPNVKNAMVTVLLCETSGSQGYLPKMRGDSIRTDRSQPGGQPQPEGQGRQQGQP